MPMFTPADSLYRTVGAGAVDQIIPQSPGSTFSVHNRSGAVDLWVRVDGIDPVPEQDGSLLVAPNSSRDLNPPTAGFPDLRVTAVVAALYGMEYR